MSAGHRNFVTIVGSLALTFILLAGLTVTRAQNGVYSPEASELDAKIAQDWMTVIYQRIEAEAIQAPTASRLYAYAAIALYESVMPGMPYNRSLSGQLNALTDLPWPEDMDTQVYDWISAANGAVYTVIDGLMADTSPETHTAFAAMRDRWVEERSTDLGDPDLVGHSLEYGIEVGEALLDWANTDHYNEIKGLAWELPTGDPSYWVFTSPQQKAVEPYWGRVRPFALQWVDECAVYPNFEFSTDPDSTFYKQAMEVKEVGDNLTNQQKDIARFWVDTPGQTGTPSGHWVMIQAQLVDVLGLKLDQAAMMFGMTNFVLADAFTSTWSLKYQILLLRPETYINRYISRSWKPYIQTPGFPEYPSGHSTVSTAGSEILTSLFGTVAFTDNSAIVHRMQPRSFTSFEAAASEAAISRLYGGIHYRAAIENGIDQGRCVAERALDYVTLLPLAQGE